MKIIFLGTNGWYDTATGDTICVLLETEQYYIILDAGNGLHKLDRHITIAKPVYLFLSHFHLDHIIGLHMLNKFDLPQGLYICGQTGTRNVLDIIINKPFTVPLNGLRFKTEVYELPEEKSNLPFRVDTLPLLHSSATLGFRFEIDHKVVVYCPDTGYCENAVILSKEADLLIAECAYKSGQVNERWPHLNPESAAQLAKIADVKRLALVHFDASIYKTAGDRKEAVEQAKKIFDNTFAGTDNMQIEV